MLKQLTVSFRAFKHSVSILTPVVEKVSWRCFYTRSIYGLGLWGLKEVGLKTAETPGLTDSAKEPPSVHVLSLHMCAKVCLLSCLLNLPDLLAQLNLFPTPF